MRSGLLFGAGAYAMWGLFPAFFPLLKPAGAVEVLAHRIIWSFVLMVVVVTAVRRLGDLRQITGRVWLLLTAAAALISVNWLIYVYAVNNGHVVDAALGYFINVGVDRVGADHLSGEAEPLAGRRADDRARGGRGADGRRRVAPADRAGPRAVVRSVRAR